MEFVNLLLVTLSTIFRTGKQDNTFSPLVFSLLFDWYRSERAWNAFVLIVKDVAYSNRKVKAKTNRTLCFVVGTQ